MDSILYGTADSYAASKHWYYWHLIAIGVGCGTLIFLLSFFLPTPPRMDASSPESIAAAKIAEEEDQRTTKYKNTVDLKTCLKKKETWLIFFMYACAAMGGQMMTSQMSKIAQIQFTTGDVAAVTATMIMALGLANGLGRLCVSTVADRLGVINTWRLIFLVQIINILCFRFYTGYASLVVGTFVLGSFYGATIPMVYTTVATIFGRKSMGSIHGVITNGISVAALVGPLISSNIVDATGSYNPAFWFWPASWQLDLHFRLVCRTIKKIISEDTQQGNLANG